MLQTVERVNESTVFLTADLNAKIIPFGGTGGFTSPGFNKSPLIFGATGPDGSVEVKKSGCYRITYNPTVKALNNTEGEFDIRVNNSIKRNHQLVYSNIPAAALLTVTHVDILQLLSGDIINITLTRRGLANIDVYSNSNFIIEFLGS